MERGQRQALRFCKKLGVSKLCLPKLPEILNELPEDVMSQSELATIVESLNLAGKIGAEVVLKLRRAVFSDSFVSPQEAQSLIELNRNCFPRDVSWNVFFVEALTDYLVHQADPAGYVTAENAEWLISVIMVDGHVNSSIEMELVISILDQAMWSPPSLVNFALEEVKHWVVDGSGSIRKELDLVPGQIGEAEVDLLRRILYSFGGEWNIAISRQEAELLFDLNDATAGANNHPSWSELFVKAIANHIMAGSGYQVPSRQEALKREAWLESEETTSGFFSKMFSGGFSAVLEAYKAQTPEEAAVARLEQQRLEIVTGEIITQSEASWLTERLQRDGELHDNEKALLRFLKEESPDIHPSLKTLIDQAA